MPTYFHKPENALKRAKEFIEVDKKESALEVLNDVIKSKKHRTSGNKVHEEIANLFLVICTDLQKSSTAKNGLYQYRNISGNVDPASFDKVVTTFLKNANDRASKARDESQQAVMDIDDLDQLQTPESLLLNTVSDEDTQARTDRVMLTPWVKFLWESYRNILELTKNNQTFEKLYTEVAKEAFKFCIEYKRRTEFRKLCDTLRNHLQLIQKHQPPTQSYAINLSAPDSKSIQYQVEVRFEQLERSIQIDLWQEAFKAIEEIHNLLTTTKTQSKPSTYFNFYSRQARVYWMANNRLFHAAAMHCQFVLIKEQKKISNQEELQKLASQVLLATLAIPIVPVSSESTRFLQHDNYVHEKDRRLASLLKLSVTPTRHSLHKDLVRLGVLQYAPEELRQLYQLLEVDYDPLSLCAHVTPILITLEEKELLKQYVEPLKEVTVVRLIKEVSQLYQSITFNRLQELMPFVSRWELEKVVVETAMSNKIQVCIDHRTESLQFGTDLTTLSHEENIPEGPFVQGMPSDQLRSHLVLMSQALNQAVQLISKEKIMVAHHKEQARLVSIYHQHEVADHKSLLRRQTAIEDRKEYIEHVQKEKEKMEYDEKKEKEKKEHKAEELRLKKEREDREKERRRQEEENLKKQMQMEKLEQLKKTAVGMKVLSEYSMDDLGEIDPDEIVMKQLKQLEKQRKDLMGKLKQQEKKIDYFERAKRLEEISLLQKYCQEQAESDRRLHEEQEEERIATTLSNREEDLTKKTALSKMVEDKDEFLEFLKSQRHEVFMEKFSAYKKMFDEVKQQRLEERRNQRRVKRKQEYLIEMKQKKEEEERLARERAEEEERERLERQMKIQKEKEREIEERQRRKEEEIRCTREADERPDVWRKGDRDQKGDSWRNEDDKRSPHMDRQYGPPRGRDDDGYYDDRGPPRREDGGWRGRDEGRWLSRDDRRGYRDERRDNDDNWRRDDRSRDLSPSFRRSNESRRDASPQERRKYVPPGGRYQEGRDQDDRDRGWRRSDDRDEKWRSSRDDDRPPRDVDKPRYRDDDRPRYRDDDRPHYRDDDRSRYRDDDRPRYRDDRRDKPRFRDDDDRPPRDFDKPRYRDDDRPPRDQDRPRYREDDRPPRDFDKPRYRDDDRPPRDQDRPRYREDDRPPRDFDKPRYRDDDRPPRDQDRPRYREDDRPPRDFDKPRYREDDRPPRDQDRPRYREDDRPPRDQDRPRYREDDRRWRDEQSEGSSRRYVPPSGRRYEGRRDDDRRDDRGPPRRDDGGWRGRDEGGGRLKDDRRGYKGRDEDGWRRDDRRDASPRRNKQEREVDEEGFETVRTRR